MGGITTLVRDGHGRTVVVPEVDELTPDLLQAILRSAALSFTELYAALAAIEPRPRTVPPHGAGDDPPSSV